MGFFEKRQFTRIPFEIDARVTSGESVIQSDSVRDISLGGMFIGSEEPLPKGAHCEVAINAVGPSSSFQVCVEGKVVRTENGGFALRFTEMDVDSLVNLRHLIRIRAADPEQVDREYSDNLIQDE